MKPKYEAFYGFRESGASDDTFPRTFLPRPEAQIGKLSSHTNKLWARKRRTERKRKELGGKKKSLARTLESQNQQGEIDASEGDFYTTTNEKTTQVSQPMSLFQGVEFVFGKMKKGP